MSQIPSTTDSPDRAQDSQSTSSLKRSRRRAEALKEWEDETKEAMAQRERKRARREAGLEEGLFIAKDKSGKTWFESREVPVSHVAEKKKKMKDLDDEFMDSIPPSLKGITFMEYLGYLDIVEGSDFEDSDDDAHDSAVDSKSDSPVDTRNVEGAENGNLKRAGTGDSVEEGVEHEDETHKMYNRLVHPNNHRTNIPPSPQPMSITQDTWSRHSWAWASPEQRDYLEEIAVHHRSFMLVYGPEVGRKRVLRALRTNWLPQWPVTPALIAKGLLPPDAADRDFELNDDQRTLVHTAEKECIQGQVADGEQGLSPQWTSTPTRWHPIAELDERRDELGGVDAVALGSWCNGGEFQNVV
ncbi:hypothetical protein DFP72DRAFT_854554 [Ephemerocybe angulata]|uniref:Uncharacterized protein n=1 Tax=Ephemerocybe angulata TaxID=980116 RepID=A0A8H6HK27_9AGAR|nr:hypothetical protein DFP72DRAFT_854554 [Tulosesus angulatus]